MILISTGHHEEKRGASFDDFYEHDEARIWAAALVSILGEHGLAVPLGRLEEKVKFINNTDNVDIAIEIHFNSAKNASGENIGNGCETLYYPKSKNGMIAANLIQDAMAKTLKPDRGIKEGYFRLNKSNGVNYFLARTKCISLIIEPEFIHHKDLIQNGRNIVCKDIAEGLIKFSNNKKS